MKTRLAAILILASFVLPPVAAAATAGPVFGLRAVGNPKRGYFIYAIAPGAPHSGAVIVSNTGNRTGTVKLYSADGATGQTTGTVYLTDRKPTGAGSWVTLSQSSVKLAPGAVRRVPFTVRVPDGADAGQWVAGIVAETATSAKTKRSTRKAGVQIRIRNQTIIAVQVNVPGPPAASFTIGGVKTGGQRGFQQVLVHFANTGNVLQKPTGFITIQHAGTPVQRLPFKMDTFLPQTEIDYPVLLKKALAAGDYETKVSLTFATPGGGQKTITASPPLTVSNQDVQQVFTATSAAPTQQPPGGVVADSGSSTPWALIAGAAAAVLLLLLAAWLLLRRRSRRGGEDDDEPLQVLLPPAPAAPTRAEQPPAPAAPARAEQPPAPVEPTPPPVAPTPPVQAEEAAPAEPAAAPRPSSPACDPHHYWEVAYERGTLGDDGVWRFPHRCQNCGLELLATDIADATAQAEQPVH
jgi:LPXTG-motif cell wall-anchored protein